MSRVALITGASRGIGAAVAARLSDAGWRLSLGLRDLDAPGLPDGAHLAPYDAYEGNEGAWVEAARAAHGRIDAVIACAGIMEPVSVIEADDAALDRMWAVNVKAPRRLVQAAWGDLTASGAGRVILLASLSGKRVKSAGSASYAMSKHAVVALGHGIRQAGWEDGVRATCICPGFVNTDMGTAVTEFPPEKMTPPGEVARLVELALDLPNEASTPEITVNCTLEARY